MDENYIPTLRGYERAVTYILVFLGGWLSAAVWFTGAPKLSAIALAVFFSIMAAMVRNKFLLRRTRTINLYLMILRHYHEYLMRDYRLIDTGMSAHRVERDKNYQAYTDELAKAPKRVRKLVNEYVINHLSPYMTDGGLVRELTVEEYQTLTHAIPKELL